MVGVGVETFQRKLYTLKVTFLGKAGRYAVLKCLKINPIVILLSCSEEILKAGAGVLLIHLLATGISLPLFVCPFGKLLFWYFWYLVYLGDVEVWKSIV